MPKKNDDDAEEEDENDAEEGGIQEEVEKKKWWEDCGFFETGSKQELAVLNTGPHCRHLARNASRARKPRPLSEFGGRM